MDRSSYYRSSKSLIRKLYTLNQYQHDLRLSWPKGSTNQWKKEHSRISLLIKAEKNKRKQLNNSSDRAAKRSHLGGAPKKPKRPKKPKKPELPQRIIRGRQTEEAKLGRVIKKIIPRAAPVRAARAISTSREIKEEDRKVKLTPAEEAAKIALKRQKKFNVFIDATYRFDRDPSEQKETNLEGVDITFSTKAFTEFEVRQVIDTLRKDWEDRQNGIINGRSNWTWVRYNKIEVVEIKSGQLAEVPMLATKLNYTFTQCYETNNKDECVIDYLHDEITRYNSKAKEIHCTELSISTRDQIKSTLGNKNYKGYTTNDIVEFAQKCKYISVYALNANLEVFNFHKASLHCRIQLCFIVNNKHCYPITKLELKKQIRHKKRIDLEPILFDDFEFDKNMIFFDSQKEYLKWTTPQTEIQNIENKTSCYKYPNYILIDTHQSLLPLLKQTMTELDQIIPLPKITNNKVIAYNDPRGFVVASSKDYHMRKHLVDQLKIHKPEYKIPFENQTWSKLSMQILEETKDLKKSVLSKEVREAFNAYLIRPYHKEHKTNSDLANTYGEHKTTYDINKSYTNVMLKNDTPWNVFTGFDTPKPYNQTELQPGEYFINKKIEIAPSMILPKSFYPLNIVQYMLDNNCISKTDITYQINATFHLPSNYFKDIVEFFYNMPIDDDFKQIVGKALTNHLSGLLNKKYNNINHGAITNDYLSAISLFTEETVKNNKCFITKIENVYLVKSTQSSLSYSTSSPIYRQIIAGGIIELAELTKQTVNQNSIIVRHKVDSISIINPIIPTLSNEIGGIKEEPFPILNNTKRDWLVDEVRPTYNLEQPEWKEEDWNVTMDISLLQGSCLITGMSGSGKTTTLKKSIPKDKNIIVRAYTNKAVNVLKDKGINSKQVDTLDHLLQNPVTKQLSYTAAYENLKNIERLDIDEYGMVPYQHLQLLSRLQDDLKFDVRMFGDPRQTSAVQGGKMWKKLYTYENEKLVMSLCGYRKFNMQYIDGCGRYDKTLYRTIIYFLKHSKLPKWTNKLKKCNINLAFTNKKCKQINQKKINSIKSKSINKSKFKINSKKTQNKIGDYCLIKLIKGMPIISNANLLNIKKSERTIIKKVFPKKKQVNIKNPHSKKHITISFEDLLNNFDYGYCMTVHRMQGDEINEDYNIYEVEKMSKELLYTAIGRGKKLSQIHFNSSKLKSHYLCMEDRAESIQII